MENKDFDKLFARKMQGLPPVAPSINDWYALQQRITAEKSRRERWRRYGLYALLLLLALSNICLWRLWKQQPDPITKPATSIVVIDTLVKNVVYQNDTIVKTIYITAYSNLAPAAASWNTPKRSLLPQLEGAKRDRANSQIDGPSPMEKNGAPALPEASEKDQTSSPDKLKTHQTSDPGLVNPRDSAEAVAKGHSAVLSTKEINTDENNQAAQSPKIKPAKHPFFSAPQASFFIDNAMPAGNGVQEGKAVGLGVQLNAKVAPYIRIWSEIGYQWLQLESDNTAISNLAESPYSSAEYEIRHWEAQTKAISLGLGFRYDGNPLREHWWPTISSGVINLFTLPYPVNIEYHRLSSGGDIHWPGTIEHPNSLTAWQSSLGLGYSINNRFSLGAEGFYRLNLKPGHELWKHQGGLRLHGIVKF